MLHLSGTWSYVAQLSNHPGQEGCQGIRGCQKGRRREGSSSDRICRQGKCNYRPYRVLVKLTDHRIIYSKGIGKYKGIDVHISGIQMDFFD
jgi:hypothetical protein